MKKKYGEFAGVPYDFRRPTWKRIKERMWNEKDKRVFTPKSYGIGWTMNFRNPKSFLVLAAIIAFVIFSLAISGLL